MGGDDKWSFGTGGFGKLYGDRLRDSSLLDCDVETRWVFVWMLSQADAEGRYRCASVGGLARACAVTIDAAERAVNVLESPDPASTTPDNEGRRIERIEGGWRVLNYCKYREHKTAKQEKGAERQRRWRERQALRERYVTPGNAPNDRRQRSESKSKASNKQQRSIESEATNTHRSDDHDENRFRWDRSKQEFVGNNEPIRQKLAELGYYDEPLGREWINAVWWRINDWAKTEMRNGKPRIETYRDYKAFVLKWFMREAQRKRELER